ncbi:MAG: calcium-binding protein [Micavibrio sp.]|nr:calcium-binding protein [Micavibrio sp.]
MATAAKITVTSTGNTTDILNATGTDLQTATSSTDMFISNAFPFLWAAIESDDGINASTNTSTHYAGHVVANGAAFDIKGSGLGSISGISTITSMTYTDDDNSSFTVTGTLKYDNSIADFTADSRITSISVVVGDSVHTYNSSSKDLVLADYAFGDNEIAFSAGHISSEVIETAAAKVTLTGNYLGLDDSGTITGITIEDPAVSGNKVVLTNLNLDAQQVIGTLGDIGSGHLSDFFSTDAAPLFAGADTIIASGALGIHGFDGNDIMSAVSTTSTISSTLFGDAGNDTLTGGGASDTLNGGADDDTLDGGKGNDLMTGGTGNDVYYVDSLGDQVVENADVSGAPASGIDTVHATVTGYTLTANVENLILDGSVASGTGNALANEITGNASANTIDGGDGNDTLSGLAGNDVLQGGLGDDRMDGGAGNDTYFVDSSADSIIDSAGTDTVHSTISYTLGAGLENLILDGVAPLNGTGNELSNSLTGNTGANILDGGLGADVMTGGDGNDTYYVDNTSDKIVEGATTDSGTDAVVSTANYTLSANVESLELIGLTATQGTGNNGANNIQGTEDVNYTLNGGAGDDVLSSSSGNDTLDGGTGNDSLTGGLGDDTYIVDSADDNIFENADQGADLVQSTAASYTLAANVENLTLMGTASINGTGNDRINIILGNSGNNTLDGAGISDALPGGLDTLIGGKGNDTYILHGSEVVSEDANGGTDTVSTGSSYTLLANFENLTLTGIDDVNGTGNDAVNVLTGNGGNNTLDGGVGADTMNGGDGDNVYFVDNAADKVIGGADLDTVMSGISYSLAATGTGTDVENLVLSGAAKFGTGNALDNIIDASVLTVAATLTGGAGADSLIGGTGNDTLDGGTGNDRMEGGLGNDTYIVDSATDLVVESMSGGTDLVKSSADYTLAANVENLTLTGTGDISAVGNTGDNVITGNTGDNYLAGGGGTDTLMGGAGNDTYLYTGSEVITDSSGTKDTVIIATGTGYDLNTNPDGFSGIENLTLAAGMSTITSLVGNGSVNVLTGNEFDNTLNGQAGADTMVGGDGSDRYFVDNAKDVIIENTGEGLNDAVLSTASYKLSANIESLALLGTAALVGTGNDLDNVITATGAGNHTLDGGAGADTMQGDAGNDTYYVDSLFDVVIDDGGTKDLVVSVVDYTLGADIENLTLSGLASATATGNTGVNIITGNAGNNILDGAGVTGLGNDTLSGGAGNDTYMLHSGTEVLKETSGIDTINLSSYSGSATSWTLATGFENLQLGGTAHYGIGNTAANSIVGTTDDDTLDGKAGADNMNGGDGDDTYYVDNANDAIIDSSGTDTVHSTISFTLAPSLENLFLDGTGAINGTGNDASNTITGNTGNNTLDGGAGDDLLIGGKGNDFYIVDSVNDAVSEFAGEGADTVASSTISLNLVDYAFVENITLLAGGFTATGNSGVNVLTGSTGNDKLFGMDGNDVLVGNDGNDTLDGGLGNDTMTGGAGGDNYYVDAIGDKVIEAAAGGTDTVNSTINYTLGTNVENLNLLGTALVGTGNSTINTLTGNELGNTLDGKAGADNMIGGDGDDTYYVDNTGDTITEVNGGGLDVEYASVSTSIAAFVETLILSGTGNIDADGTGGIETLIGNSGNNTFNGKGGADILIGAKGNDTYYYTGVEHITENVNEGSDTLLATTFQAVDLNNADFTNIENATAYYANRDYTFTGTDGINVLTGNGGNDTLDGGLGNDKLIGGAGNDVYYVDSKSDTITEAANEGIDTVHSTASTFTLGNNVENLVLETGAISGVGNALDNIITGNDAVNTLTGNAGNDTLDGGIGADKLIGGAGNDHYYVDVAGDVITETSSGGHDTVHSTALTYTLGSYVEDIILEGVGNISATGNTLANVMTGNDGDNTLDGGAGDDTLAGGLGVDHLTGGAGNDTFVFHAADLGHGVDVITDFTHTSATAHDVIDIADILSNATDYIDGTSNINDYVHLTGTGGNYTLSIDADGTGAGAAVNIVTFTMSDTAATVDTLISNHDLVVLHSA